MTALFLVGLAVVGQTVDVRSLPELRAALGKAQPGTTIRLAAGTYDGGVFAENVRGEAGRPIRIVGAERARPPLIRGGTTGLQLSGCRYVEVEDLRFENCRANGVNIDDGGNAKSPAMGIVLRRISVRDLPAGNHDGIKLSGLVDFRVEACTVERWGGSGIDMVGCQNGVIVDCMFRMGGDSGVQAKGGSRGIRIERCRFVDSGHRGVNAGGSTGFAFFRPSLDSVAPGQRFEAKDISIRGCTFVRGMTPVAFVGCDGATFAFNTVVEPGRWAMRILQETRDPSFVPCRRGRFEDNVIVFLSSQWGEGGVNVGPGTEPASFAFARNWWFCADRPSSSRPRLPASEAGGIYGEDPLVTVGADGVVRLGAGSKAKRVGAEGFRGGGTG